MKRLFAAVLILALLAPAAPAQQSDTRFAASAITGFRNAAVQRQLEERFMAVPDPKMAEQHMQTLSAAPHMSGTIEDFKTAEYVAQRFREAGLETRIEEYKVWMNYPVEVTVETSAPPTLKMRGPTPERVADDPFQNDPRIVIAFNGGSPSCDVEAEVVYANYGRPEDLKKLKDFNIDVRGKIILVRYGQNFRGVKSFVAEQAGAAGVIIYSDPADDGFFRGDMYPRGPYRPETGVQRGSIEYMFQYPGDPTTPGIASVPTLPDSRRTPPEKAANLPKIPTTPLSYADAQPLLANLAGPESPREWQGALPFTYHVGPGPVRVRMHLKQDYKYRTIWNVVGTLRGSTYPDEWVVAGNHRDAWVYGAVDPVSGTAAMLEAVHGLGTLIKAGWRPKRTIVFGSWDAEEQGLMGSTEFAEQYAAQLRDAVAYFNTDVAVAGPNFGASAVPSLKQFIRDITRAVPSPRGANVYEVWRTTVERGRKPSQQNPDVSGLPRRAPAAETTEDVHIGDLGSGSDYTAFLQHFGVPSTDVGSGGPYGVYHSVFDNFAWFKKFGDPTFAYEQQMARILGLEVLRMAEADVLPYDYAQYGKEIISYIEAARKRAEESSLPLTAFAEPLEAARRFQAAGKSTWDLQRNRTANLPALNSALRAAERALLTEGLPNRPWFRHAIYAPGEYTGYAAVVIPGVNEAIDKNDAERMNKQLATLKAALNRAAAALEGAK
ncbi:MAG TPA: M28 family metallopeptidase [Clostridia bacterium]|nr:M28 family metallopeptidase [Clostridia bacterium]